MSCNLRRKQGDVYETSDGNGTHYLNRILRNTGVDFNERIRAGIHQ